MPHCCLLAVWYTFWDLFFRPFLPYPSSPQLVSNFSAGGDKICKKRRRKWEEEEDPMTSAPRRILARHARSWLLLTVLVATTTAYAQQSLGQYYMGCWGADGTQVLNGTVRQDMTNALCIALCRDQGFPLAGTQGAQCFCSQTSSRLGPAEDKSCNTPCGGDAAQQCGGPGVMSVYATAISLLPPPPAANRPPYTPTLLRPPNAWAPALPPVEVLLSWHHNGDPEHQMVRFFLMLYQFNNAAQQWRLVTQNWVTEGTSLVVKDLAPGGYYAWQVYAFDGSLWSPPSAPSVFATLPQGPLSGNR
jgi:WSC domain